MRLQQIALGCLLAACVTPVLADSYLGLQAGQSKYKDWITPAEYKDVLFSAEQAYGWDFQDIKTEDGDAAFKVYAGFPLSENADVRIGYANLGEAAATATDPINGIRMEMTYEAQAIFIEGLAKFKPTPALSLFAKAGMAYTMSELEIAAKGPEGSASEPIGESKQLVLVPGLGLSYDFTPKVGLIVEVERYLDVGDDDETPQLDIDVASAGLYFRF